MKNGFVIKLILFFLAASVCLAAIAFFFGEISLPSSAWRDAAAYADAPKYTTVIIDAGHGGEDGGTSSASGLIEKELNLEIAKLIAKELEKQGVHVILTRSDDRLLYDPNSDYQGRKKKLDLAARLEIMKQYDNAIFVSIHMNAFTDKSCSGLQVWYSKNLPESYELAKTIQNNARLRLQPDNKRVVKAATSAIHLLENATCPAVLIECGFLSNPAEASLFESAEHRSKVAQNIAYSISEFLKTADQSS
jgi:N-acetylmuramoyl-L-alanine amidase